VICGDRGHSKSLATLTIPVHMSFYSAIESTSLNRVFCASIGVTPPEYHKDLLHQKIRFPVGYHATLLSGFARTSRLVTDRVTDTEP